MSKPQLWQQFEINLAPGESLGPSLTHAGIVCLWPLGLTDPPSIHPQFCAPEDIPRGA